MEILGYFLAILIGLALGLIGGGGSILTVPVLVYILGINPIIATGYSLFIVGISAATGFLKYFQIGQVDVKTGIIFAIPSFIAVFLTRLYLIPALPDTMFTIGNFPISKETFLMVFFALLMVVAAFSMLKQKQDSNAGPKKLNIPVIALEGLVVGVITGLVGAGGGFIIIPALVLFAGMPMKKAVGTSLMIIAIKSLIGFTGDLVNLEIDWFFLLSFSVLALAGIFIGTALAKKIDGSKLKKGFAYFLIVLSIVMLVAEFS